MLLQTCFPLRDFPTLRLEFHSSARAHQKPFAVAVCILSQAYFLRFLSISTREKVASSIPYHLPQNCWLPHRKIKSTRAKNLRNAESSLKPRRRQWQPSGTLAWTIPWMEEPGRLRSMRSLRVGHDWSSLVAAAALKPWGMGAGNDVTRDPKTTSGRHLGLPALLSLCHPHLGLCCRLPAFPSAWSCPFTLSFPSDTIW